MSTKILFANDLKREEDCIDFCMERGKNVTVIGASLNDDFPCMTTEDHSTFRGVVCSIKARVRVEFVKAKVWGSPSSAGLNWILRVVLRGFLDVCGIRDC